MNENFIKKFENATINFCNTFEDCEKNITDLKKEIDNLEKNIRANETLYKLGSGQTAEDITPESVFLGMSDTEKINLSGNVGNDRVSALDDDGNIIVDYNSLNYETKKYFEDAAKSMSTDRKTVENDVQIANLRVEALRSNLMATISSNYAALLKEQSKFNLAIGEIDLVSSDYAHRVNRCNSIMRNIASDITIDATQMKEKLNEQENELKKAKAGQAICSALKSASNAYSKAFNGVINAIDPKNAEYKASVDNYLSKDNREKIVDELNVLDNLNKLIQMFSEFKKSYDEERKLVDEIKKQTKEFSKKHGRTDEFYKAVNTAVIAVDKAIEMAEAANGLDLNDELEQNNTETQTQAKESTPDESTEKKTSPDESTEKEPTNDESTEKEPTNDESTEKEITPEKQTEKEPVHSDSRNDYTDVNKDPMFRVNRKRMANVAKRHALLKVSTSTLLAGCGLGLLGLSAGSIIAAVGGIGAVGSIGWGAISGAVTNHRRRSITKKLKKIAKEMEKTGIPGFKLGTPDYENGTINFIMEDKDKKEVIVTSSTLKPHELSFLNDLLSKEFHNENRGLGDAKPQTFEQRDLKEFPKVTVDNLQAAYAIIGGVRSLKDDVLGSTPGWKTSSNWIGKVKDSRVFNWKKDKNKSDAEEVGLDELNHEKEEPLSEREVVVGQNQDNATNENESAVSDEELQTLMDMFKSNGEENSQTSEKSDTMNLVDIFDDETKTTGDTTIQTGKENPLESNSRESEQSQSEAVVPEDDDMDLSELVESLSADERELFGQMNGSMSAPMDPLEEGHGRTR